MVGLENPLHIAIVLIVVLMVFGAKRLPEMGKSLGEGLRGFKDSVSGTTPSAAVAPAPVAPAPAPLAVAPAPVALAAAPAPVVPEATPELEIERVPVAGHNA
jgi:sec-independent protein translocase protein TatA